MERSKERKRTGRNVERIKKGKKDGRKKNKGLGRKDQIGQRKPP